MAPGPLNLNVSKNHTQVRDTAHMSTVRHSDVWHKLCKMFCRQQHPGPVIGIIECPKLQALRESVRALDDFPCVTIPCNARDNNYQVRNGSLVVTFSCDFTFFALLFCLHLAGYLSRRLVAKRQLVEQACSAVLHQPNGSMKEFHSLDMHM
jgi:hypothetical protein